MSSSLSTHPYGKMVRGNYIMDHPTICTIHCGTLLSLGSTLLRSLSQFDVYAGRITCPTDLTN